MNEGGFSARGIRFKIDHKICALTVGIIFGVQEAFVDGLHEGSFALIGVGWRGHCGKGRY